MTGVILVGGDSPVGLAVEQQRSARAYVRFPAVQKMLAAMLETLARRAYRGFMSKLFAPYAGSQPASLNINGHRLWVLAHDPEILTANLKLFGGDRIKKVNVPGEGSEQEEALSRLAESSHTGVVIAPSEIGVSEFIRTLENQLPWVH